MVTHMEKTELLGIYGQYALMPLICKPLKWGRKMAGLDIEGEKQRKTVTKAIYKRNL